MRINLTKVKNLINNNMKTSSAKAKGRRFQHFITQKISDLLGIPCGKDELIESREMGQSGSDVKLIGPAKKLFPFSYIECKNQEKFKLNEWINQARDGSINNNDWILFVKKNRWNPVVVLDVEKFFEIMKYYKEQNNDN